MCWAPPPSAIASTRFWPLRGRHPHERQPMPIPMIRLRRFGYLIAPALAMHLAGCSTTGPPNPTNTSELAQFIHSAVDRPLTIPSIRQWTRSQGEYALTPDSRLLLSSNDQQLMQTASLFVSELTILVGYQLPIVAAANTTPRSGDIRWVLAIPQTDSHPEGYTLDVCPVTTLSATDGRGIFYGTRTLLQLFKQNLRIPAGTAVDWPRYPERGMVIDIARKHYSRAWLERQIRDLAYLKMNYLHLHISDDQGIGVQLDQGPPYAGSDLPPLTQQDVQFLVQLSHQYFITIIPEIDMPGHMR